MPKRTYSDNERATTLAVLDTNGGNLSKTSREAGVPIKTIANWRDGRVHPDVERIRIGKREEIASKIESKAIDMLGGVTQAKIKKAGVKDLMTAVGIAVDKSLLLRGEAPDPEISNKVNVFIQTHLGGGELPEF